MPTTMTPTRLSRARIIGRRKWSRRISTGRRTAALKRALGSDWNIGRSVARRYSPKDLKQGADAHVRNGSGERLLAGAADVLGPEGPDRPAHHRCDLDRRARRQVGFPEGNRPNPRAPEACDRRTQGNRRPPARHDRQAHHLARRYHGGAQLSRRRPDPRAYQWA